MGRFRAIAFTCGVALALLFAPVASGPAAVYATAVPSQTGNRVRPRSCALSSFRVRPTHLARTQRPHQSSGSPPRGAVPDDAHPKPCGVQVIVAIGKLFALGARRF